MWLKLRSRLVKSRVPLKLNGRIFLMRLWLSLRVRSLFRAYMALVGTCLNLLWFKFNSCRARPGPPINTSGGKSLILLCSKLIVLKECRYLNQPWGTSRIEFLARDNLLSCDRCWVGTVPSPPTRSIFSMLKRNRLVPRKELSYKKWVLKSGLYFPL